MKLGFIIIFVRLIDVVRISAGECVNLYDIHTIILLILYAPFRI
jgi:hypothetical protein